MSSALDRLFSLAPNESVHLEGDRHADWIKLAGEKRSKRSHPHAERPGRVGGSAPENYGIEPFPGRLGKRGYHKSTHPGVALSAKVSPEQVELLRMDVQEQGKGIGGAVLEKLKQFAKDTNRKLRLNARADTPELQPRLRAFYERHGMKPVGNDEYEWNSEVV